MALVVSVQCFLIRDGGITALGTNIFNMGIVAVWTGYLVYRLGLGGRNWGYSPSGLLGGLAEHSGRRRGCWARDRLEPLLPLPGQRSRYQ